MTAEWILVVVATGVLVLSIFLFCGKGGWLIAGYNTASPEEKARYDIKKLCKAAGWICLIVAVIQYALAGLGYMVDTGSMSEDSMLIFAILFVVVILATVVCAVLYMNTKGKK